MAKTKTNISPPVRQKPILPPVLHSANLHRRQPKEIVQMKFDVPADFRKEFKIFAAENDLTMIDLLAECYEHYKKTR